MSAPESGLPRVVCHMLGSVDGRIATGGWPLTPEGRRLYEQVHARYEPDAWMCGRVTMEPFAGTLRTEAEVARVREEPGPREDYHAPGRHESYAFALDPHGRLAWETGDIEGDHVVAVLSESVSDEYLDLLRGRGVSYLFAGAREIDLPRAIEKVGAGFGVRTLMLEGGGKINGAMLRAGLIDEVSLLIAPVVDGRMGTPAVFDAEGADPRRLVLEGVERCTDDLVWLRYRVEAAD